MFASTVPLFLRILPDTVKAYRHRTLLIVFNIARCCVFRSLLHHRNKRLYNLGYTTNGVFARHHFFCLCNSSLTQIKGAFGTQKSAWQVAVLFEIHAWHLASHFRPNSLFLARYLFLLCIDIVDLSIIFLSVHRFLFYRFIGCESDWLCAWQNVLAMSLIMELLVSSGQIRQGGSILNEDRIQ